MAEKINVEDEKNLHTIRNNIDKLKKTQVLNPNLDNLKNNIATTLYELTTPLTIFIREGKITEREILEVIKDPDLAYLYNEPLYHKVEQHISTSHNKFFIQERINQLMSEFLISVVEEVNNFYQSKAQTTFRPEDNSAPSMSQSEIDDLVGKVTVLISKWSDYSNSKQTMLLHLMNQWGNTRERFAIIESVIEKINGEKLLSKYREKLEKSREAEANGQSK